MTPYEIVCDMEEMLNTARRLTHALLMMGQSLDHDERDSAAITHVAEHALKALLDLEASRAKLFHQLHPDAKAAA